MNRDYRQAKLTNLVNQHKVISVSEIIEYLNVSPATVRRDIAKLDELGKIRKVRNGAESIKQRENLESFPTKKVVSIPNLTEKQRIAKAASAICKDGESIVLTCGTTMMILGEELCGRKLQITTNYLPLANYLIENNHDNVVIMGGQYNKNQAITFALNAHLEYSANIMFTSCKGVTTEGLYKNDILIANSEQKMCSKIDKLVALVDSSKFGKRGGMLFSELKDVDLLITGQNADPQIIAELREKGLKIILA